MTAKGMPRKRGSMENRVAQFIIKLGRARSLTGIFRISFDEIAYHFHITESWVRYHKEKIAAEVDKNRAIASKTLFEKDDSGEFSGFNINLKKTALENYQM